MANYGIGLDRSFIADVDLNGAQWYCVVAGSVAGTVKLASTLAGSIIGVLQNDPRAGEEATVRMFGFTKVRACGGSPLTYGGFVKCGSTGMVEGSLAPAASAFQVGVAMEALASGCAYVEIFLNLIRTAS